VTGVPAWLIEVPVAHRGLHDRRADVPENSLAAFRAAARDGYAAELDVQLSADGVPMAFHDRRLERLTGAEGRMAARDAAELAELRLLGTAETLPTLADVLALADGRLPLVIELKPPPERDGRLEAAVWRLLRDYDGPYVVQSFDPAVLGWFHAHAPAAVRGQIACAFAGLVRAFPVWQALPLQDLKYNWLSKPHFVAYDIDALPRPAPAAARGAGLPLLVWTVKTPRQLAKARRLADNVIFEHVAPH